MVLPPLLKRLLQPGLGCKAFSVGDYKPQTLNPGSLQAAQEGSSGGHGAHDTGAQGRL